MIEVWSCGGGTQSAAIAALIIQDVLPKPDLSIIVDTERERSSTWAYCDSVLTPALAKVGVDLVRIRKSEYATVDLWSENGDLLIPAYTDREGEVSKLPTFCSNEWKRRVLMRHLRKLGVRECRYWLGFSLDEKDRIRTGPPKWFQPWFPLIFGPQPMRRGGCVHLVEQMGWPAPPRSSCWMCPHHNTEEWNDIEKNWPTDYAKAMALQKEIHERDPHAWLKSPDDLGVKSKDCQTGFCFV